MSFGLHEPHFLTTDTSPGKSCLVRVWCLSSRAFTGLVHSNDGHNIFFTSVYYPTHGYEQDFVSRGRLHLPRLFEIMVNGKSLTHVKKGCRECCMHLSV
jgi:hypothetical protein